MHRDDEADVLPLALELGVDAQTTRVVGGDTAILVDADGNLVWPSGRTIALLGVGWRLRHQRPAYAQVLQGGAVAVLYLTLFVAFRFYGVLAVTPVFVLMAAVAALGAALFSLKGVVIKLAFAEGIGVSQLLTLRMAFW